jgi:NADPH2:quinone reductase
MSQAIVVDQPGDSSVLNYREVADPVAGSGEVLIRTTAIGINYIDIYHREGKYPVDYPFTPGKEAVGIIVALGEGVTGLAVGDRIATTEAARAYAELVVVPAEGALPVPAGLSDEVAVALPLQGMTAHYLVNSSFALEAGQTCIVHAAAGGVGLLLTQMAKAKGARVIATVSTPEKEVLAREAGADVVLGYDDFAAKARELTNGEGVHVVYDGVGKTTFDQSLAALRIRGVLVSFGSASGAAAPLDMSRLAQGGSLTVTRPTLWSFLQTAEERAWRWGEVSSAAASGELDVRVGAIFPLSDTAAAHDALTGRHTTGKVVLIP